MSVAINLQTAFGQAAPDQLSRRGASADGQALGLKPRSIQAYRLASARSKQSDLAYAARQESSATLKAIMEMSAKQRLAARLQERGYTGQADRPTLTDLLEEDLLRKHYKRVSKIAGTFNKDPTHMYDENASSRALDESIARMIKAGDPRVLDPSIQTLIGNSEPLTLVYEASGLPMVPVPDVAGEVANAVSEALQSRTPKTPLRRSKRARTSRFPPQPEASEPETEAPQTPSPGQSSKQKSPNMANRIASLSKMRKRKPATTAPSKN